ncbi:prepilin-type N-terminal cleavage/methylation domain-containing protein [Fibrobacter sp. UWB15]|jgi:prepilin-type N-terminal cleavage/methylation domain-containing protein|uniref:prepilin-type N-terminal cleavage/methylation domain-containing protein n=1 Tax=unclassified Fibrobacter TaxID=2634177 RepID=UPI0009209FD4|nr:prepilin-type N-terminal cleavage/methylation domain-containing protein [Fibrobacter sp. UWB6]SHF84684.1 prepilin-type N-terminal cleavage/methylation domain-containing protein [Fibrobacter sp. UWB8]SMG17383.1 prepilin-type N-terminal cleavage/methylation domain-containing protein [Fibrobacter sp. UWB15]
MKGKYKTKRGFTLIEILVVIVVLGVLSGIAVPKLIGYTEKTTRHTVTSVAPTMNTNC